MDRIRRFQRTMILALTALNSLVYCVSMDFSLSRTLLISGSATSLAALCILTVTLYSKNRYKRKAALKNQSEQRIS